MKTNIKMRVTPEQSKRVQEICFENSIYWWSGRNIISHVDCPFLFISKNNITQSENESFYIREKEEEIDADLFIRTNGTCEEDNIYKIGEIAKRCAIEFDNFKNEAIDTLNKYVVESTILNLEQKLKKKNEILKKARIKRKNQREELHKLNLKLQKCISLEEHDLKMKTVLNEKHKLEVESNELSNFFDLCLGYSRDKRMPLSSYTEDLFRNSKKKQAILYECNLKQNKEIEKLKAVIEYLESKAK